MLKNKSNTYNGLILNVLSVIGTDWISPSNIARKMGRIFISGYTDENGIYPYLKKLVQDGIIEKRRHLGNRTEYRRTE